MRFLRSGKELRWAAKWDKDAGPLYAGAETEGVVTSLAVGVHAGKSILDNLISFMVHITVCSLDMWLLVLGKH